MRWIKEVTSVCQNCIYSNNEKGQWIKRRFKHNYEEGWWHIYCEKKKRFFAWNRYKRCFKSNEKKFTHSIINRCWY